MKKLFLIFVILFTFSCAPTVYKPTQFQNENDLRIIMIDLWNTEEDIKNIAWKAMPGGNKAFALSQFSMPHEKNKDKFTASQSYIAFSPNLEIAKKKSLDYCKKLAKGKTYLFSRPVNYETCKVYIAHSFNKKKISIEEKRQLAQQREVKKEQIKISNIIDESKKTCKLLGMKEGTDKFSDCALKLYTQKIDIAAKENQKIVSVGMSGNSVTIYDPVRDNEAMMKRGQGLINGTCTLGDLSNC